MLPDRRNGIHAVFERVPGGSSACSSPARVAIVGKRPRGLSCGWFHSSPIHDERFLVLMNTVQYLQSAAIQALFWASRVDA